MTIGHEWSGNIVKVGANVQGFKEGDFITAEGHVTCGKCRACICGHRNKCISQQGIGVNLDGAFAEFVKVPQENIWKSSPAVKDRHLSIFDPFGNAVMTSMAFPMVGEDVLVSGAGPIGLMAVMIAKKTGARKIVVTDVMDERLETAKALGADLVLNPKKNPDYKQEMKNIGIMEGIDVGL